MPEVKFDQPPLPAGYSWVGENHECNKHSWKSIVSSVVIISLFAILCLLAGFSWVYSGHNSRQTLKIEQLEGRNKLLLTTILLFGESAQPVDGSYLIPYSSAHTIFEAIETELDLLITEKDH